MEKAEVIQRLASDINDAMIQKTRKDGEEYYCLKDGSPNWMQYIIWGAHGDRLPDDSVYTTIARDVLPAILDAESDIESIEEGIREIEADVYTSDLTEWLNDSNENVYYLTEALEETDIKDGFRLLSYAQYLWRQEIATDLLAALVKEAEK